jgi:hypothetical protein
LEFSKTVFVDISALTGIPKDREAIKETESGKRNLDIIEPDVKSN